jgi:hypothetical protein
MLDLQSVLSFLGASGFVGAVGAIFAQGRLHQRVDGQQQQLDRLDADHRETANAHGAMAIALGRVEERMGTIKDDLAEIKAAVRKD